MAHKKTERLNEILTLRKQGKTLQEIADIYGITRSRVSQILQVESGVHRNAYKRGVTPVEYEEMLRKQSGVCMICKEPPHRGRLHIDHDHRTGEIRGLLCHYCNLGIGNLRDSVVLLESALNYLLHASTKELLTE